MEFDYFYGQQADQYAFYRIPKILFTDKRFWNISADAKLLYGLLLDRMQLSAKNGWSDKDGRVYIIYTVENVKEALGCGNKKAGQLFSELENKAGLIERKRQGLGKPNLIFVKNFISSPVDRHFLKCQNDTSGDVESTFQEMSKGHGNDTDINNTDISDTDPFFSSENGGKEPEAMRTRMQYEAYFREQLEYDFLLENKPLYKETIEEIFHLILDTVCSNRKMIRIAGDDKPIDVVRSQFMKLNSTHIEFVLDCLKENTSDVRNAKQYLLATIYNAPLTISSYYDMKVNHDMNRGLI